MMAKPYPSALPKVIGRWHLTGLIINSVVGAGIFGLPSSIATQVGDYAPWAYVLGALMTAITVAVVVELSSQFDEPGGAYLYTRKAFGAGLGIQAGWFSWLARVTTAAAITNLLTSYLAGFWPVLAGAPPRCASALLIVGALALVNIRSAERGTRLSTFFTVLKLLPLVALVVLGAMHWNEGAKPTAALAVPGWQEWTEALIAMVFAFSGFESAMIPGSEMKDPLHDTKRAAFTALLVVSTLYVCLHLAVMRAVPGMAGTDRPLSDAAAVYAGEAGRTVIALAAIVSTFGWLSAAAMTAPRLTYGMAKQGDLPALFGRVHSNPNWSTPWVSILLWAALVIGLACYGTFIWNVVLSVAARLVVYSSMCAAVIKLRRDDPNRPATRAPFGITIPIAGICICVLLSTRLNLDHLLVMLVVGLVGVATWSGASRREK